MQRWEYCSVAIEMRPDGDAYFVAYSVEGAKHAKVTIDAAYGDRDGIDAGYRMIGQLGIDGWEMVSGTETPPHSYMYGAVHSLPVRLFMFKRPLT